MQKIKIKLIWNNIKNKSKTSLRMKSEGNEVYIILFAYICLATDACFLKFFLRDLNLCPGTLMGASHSNTY